ncbi:hypothetical protein [Sporosarcina sp. 6E9]|uniref:hypothetical protein n=1 Tax=Sporosarcina sp. 6E9 TaxID=2819235 RepID=UPI001FF0B27C|nr:hypothetical protein [Sporosarcina sp. 6E9]
MNVVLVILVGVLVGCVDNTKEVSATDSSKNTPVSESKGEDAKKDNSVNDDSDSTLSENIGGEQDNEMLSKYSSEEIEYARVWLQIGANQDIDGLYVQHIPADTPLNPDDETSANYPEDVIQLAGSRLIDGSVTYSGNGDGTINVYNVPLRWDGKYPAGEGFYIDIIEDTKTVYVDPGDDEKIIALIKLLNDNQ